MSEKPDLRRAIARLLGSQLLAVLSTHRDGQPYASLVAYAFSEDLRYIYFATARTTSKFVNMQQDNRVALLVDDRANRSEDFQAASAVTIIGTASDLDGPEQREAESAYLARQPSLGEFIRAPATALLEVSVSRFILVTRFQEVYEFFPDK